MENKNTWFEVRRVARDLWMIAEPMHVVTWLYIGATRAALIDSGTGIVPIAPVVAAITDKPVVLVNTHYHFDHIGGNAEFAERLAGTKTGPLLHHPASRDLLARYLKTFPDFIVAARKKAALDPDNFALSPENEPRDFPNTFKLVDWHPGRVPATALLQEGDTIDLGDRKLQVIYTPGHSPDGITLFDAANGLLFVGDTLTEGPLYVHYDESSTKELAASVEKLRQLGTPVRLILAAHVARAIAETSLIDDTAGALAQVLAGTAALGETSDIFGYPIREARIGRVWVTQSSGSTSSYQLYDEMTA
jgi:glyoxylase-like metal-dependent hydrolase (beta-lactamase superfamily II)